MAIVFKIATMMPIAVFLAISPKITIGECLKNFRLELNNEKGENVHIKMRPLDNGRKFFSF